jgi:hypothetical protein
MKRITMLVVAICLALALPQTTAARTWSAHRIELLALRDGEEYWQGVGHHTTPCRGDARFVESPALVMTPEQKAASAGLGVASMWSTWHDYETFTIQGIDWTGDWANYEGPPHTRRFTNCIIHLYDGSWLRAQRMIAEWPAFSEDVAHELEHLENRWWTETPADGGTLPLTDVPVTSVNYPTWTCHNEPHAAQLRHPPGAPTQRAVAARSSCINAD